MEAAQSCDNWQASDEQNLASMFYSKRNRNLCTSFSLCIKVVLMIIPDTYKGMAFRQLKPWHFMGFHL
jgi:hypothetical protein